VLRGQPHPGQHYKHGWIPVGGGSSVLDVLSDLPVTHEDPNRLQPWNDPEDSGKLATLTEAMRTNGWSGPPVVVIPGHDYGWGEGSPVAVTGSHRIYAARDAGIDVPTVRLDDVLSHFGTSLAKLDEEYSVDPASDPTHEDAIRRLNEVLPREVVDHYGFDAH